MALMNNTTQIISLLSEVIQNLHVGDYEIKENWVMIIPVTECDYEHHITSYDVQSDLVAHTISIDLLEVLKKRREGRRNG